MTTQAQWPLLSAVSEWFRPSPYQRDLEFLEKCRGEEMDRLRAHVRGRPEDLRWLVGREPGSTEMLCHMMNTLKVDERKVPQETMRALERTCSGCTEKFHCADEIGNGRAGGNFESFCPNAKTLRALRD
jgi:hypothetical protein